MNATKALHRCDRASHEELKASGLRLMLRACERPQLFDDGFELLLMASCIHCGSTLAVSLGDSRALPAPEGGIDGVLERFR